MRTAILLGFALVDRAIRDTSDISIEMGSEAAYFIGVVLVVCMAMDVADFIRGK